VTQEEIIFAEIPVEKMALLSKEDLLVLLRGEQSLRKQLQKENVRLLALQEELKQRNFFTEEKYITIKNKLFGKSSERSLKNKFSKDPKSTLKKKKIQLPSQRYPDAPLIERHITLDKLPTCKCCQSEMPDSGMTEESEYLTKVPSQYYVVVQVRHKYACRKCHGDIVTAPAPPRITPGGGYSDELIIDTAVSKYCDLIPIERQAKMAAREGLKELPAQSLIEGSHQLADYVCGAYNKLKHEMLASTIWHADETPHRMLEGDKKCNWYLWGFLTSRTAYFEHHDTRSGSVASTLLTASKCEYLISDVFSGYGKAVGDTNKIRLEKQIPLIKHVYCNAHARRNFVQASEKMPQESEFFIKTYRRIYRLEKLAQKYADDRLRIRKRIKKHFEKMHNRCLQDKAGYSSKSKLGQAMGYFLNNYKEFTLFIEHANLPIDNNPAERLLRSPVIGRKTWYGTHSKRGAETAAILFSLVESCKLNQINPREYFKNLVQDLHQGKNAYTPKEYKDLAKN